MTSQAIIICGPTATGKSRLALELAKKINGEIVSADSRQIYEDMDIGTGKDLPQDAQKIFSQIKFNNKSIPYYLLNDVKIWGYDLAKHNDDFSVAEYQTAMNSVVDLIISESKIPIIVGGTGFYIRSLLNPPDTMGVPQNLELRNKLLTKSINELKDILKESDLKKFELMNKSDINNPRRLIRAIEVATYKNISNSNQELFASKLKNFDLCWIGLTTDLNDLKEMVKKNVEARASKKFTQEIIYLEKNGFDWNSQAASSTGYREWKEFLVNKISQDEAMVLWVNREHQYQKRQLTWFRKNKNIKWFDIKKISNSNLVADVLDAC